MELNSPFHIESRRDERLPIELRCRVRLASGRSYFGLTECVSVGGAAIRTDCAAGEGEVVDCLLETLGYARGEVVRVTEHGVAIMFYDKDRRARSDSLRRLEDARPAARKSITASVDVRCGGREETWRLVAITFSGAELIAPHRPPIGAKLLLGEFPVRVVSASKSSVETLFEAS